MVFDAQKDSEFNSGLARVRCEMRGDPGRVVFDPKDFKGQGCDLSLEEHQLSSAELERYAIIATSLRNQIN